MGTLKLSLRWEGSAGRALGFSLPRGRGEIRGEVNDSATSPVYAVQHCAVDTGDGRIIVPPTSDEDGAEELAALLNGALVEPPSPEKHEPR